MTAATFLGLLLVWAALSVVVALAAGRYIAHRGRVVEEAPLRATQAAQQMGSVRPA